MSPQHNKFETKTRNINLNVGIVAAPKLSSTPNRITNGLKHVTEPQHRRHHLAGSHCLCLIQLGFVPHFISSIATMSNNDEQGSKTVRHDAMANLQDHTLAGVSNKTTPMTLSNALQHSLTSGRPVTMGSGSTDHRRPMSLHQILLQHHVNSSSSSSGTTSQQISPFFLLHPCTTSSSSAAAGRDMLLMPPPPSSSRLPRPRDQ